MSSDPRVEVDCDTITEFVDDAGPPPAGLAYGQTESATPATLNTVVDYAGAMPIRSVREFLVVLAERGVPKRMARVRGHGLKLLPSGSEPQAESYAVVMRENGEEVIVALFPRGEVQGIFAGTLTDMAP